MSQNRGEFDDLARNLLRYTVTKQNLDGMTKMKIDALSARIAVAAIFVFLLAAGSATAGQITLNAVERGQFRNVFVFSGNTAAATNFGGSDIIVTGSADNRRGFLTFDLASTTSTVTSALLRMEITDLLSVTSTLPLTFRDYTTGDDADLGLSQADGAATAMWLDLGDGATYGTLLMDTTSVPNGSTVDIALTAAAISDINASGGLFTIGISSDLDGDAARFRAFTQNAMTLVLTTDGPVPGNDIPEPAAVLVLGAGFLGIAALRRRGLSRAGRP